MQYYLERACKQLYIARCHGLPLREALPVSSSHLGNMASVLDYSRNAVE